MTDNTRLTLIDTVRAALVSRKPEDLLRARQLVQVKCNQSKTDVLAFLFDMCFTENVPQETVLTDNKCPYCGKVCNGVYGLKTHISRKHPEEFKQWKEKNF